MKRASIDIGSNTVLLLVGELDKGSLNELENESRVTSLGRGLDKNKKFDEESIKDTLSALQEYKDIIDGHGLAPEDVIVTATEAARVAENSHELLDEIKKSFGFKVSLINGAGEAYYTAFGVVRGSDIQEDQVTIMDVGGASTEFIKVKVEPFEVISSISLPFGSVRCTDWLKDGVFDEKMDSIIEGSALQTYKSEHLLCVAGSMTSLGSMIKGLKKFDAQAVNGTKIDFPTFLKFVSKIESLSPDVLEDKFPFLGKRAKSIVGGALLGKKSGQVLGVETFEISTLGLRYGTLFSGEIDERFRQ